MLLQTLKNVCLALLQFQAESINKNTFHEAFATDRPVKELRSEILKLLKKVK